MKPIALLSALILAALPTLARSAPGEPAAEPAAKSIKAAAGAPDASDLLFEKPQMSNAAPDSTIRYEYIRRSGIQRGPYGPPLSDEIKFTVKPGNAADNREIQVQMFSGANRIPAGPFEDMAGNPIVSLFLENHLKGLAGLLGANPRYIKNAIRKGLRERATVSPMQMSFKGKPVEGWRIVVRPFEGDALTDRMRGFDNLTYTFVTSPDVPGEIVSIEATAQKPDGGELLEEKVDYDQNAG